MSEILTVGKRGRKENVWKAELRINWTNVSVIHVFIFSIVDIMFKKTGSFRFVCEYVLLSC